jgi:hypothetical protein
MVRSDYTRLGVERLLGGFHYIEGNNNIDSWRSSTSIQIKIKKYF